MGRVIYFTTAQEKNLFKENLNKWSVSPNLSNQNFHNKLIRCIALNNQVIVNSIRPINANYKDSFLKEEIIQEGNIIWNHILVKNSKIDKFLFTNSRIESFFKDLKIEKNTLVIVDTINLRLLKSAFSFAKKHKLKIIGICTDNPYNISFSSDKNAENILKISSELDGYIALTPKLNELYNPNKKPFVMFDGVNEPAPFNEELKKEEYIFFGGSLMKKYGLYELIDAFNILKNKDLKLLIAGHHQESDLLDKIKSNNRISYLGAIDIDEITRLEKKALIAVNPRPLDPKIDEYSIPSKTLEYLSNGVLTISVDNPLLNKYKEAIIWSKTSDKNDLLDTLNKALSLSKEEQNNKIKTGINLINQYTSFNAINKQINELFKMLLD